MSAKNGKDCKHEKIGVEIEIHGKVYILEFVCENGNCTQIFDENEVVILTKEQHQLREDAVDAVTAEKNKYNEWVGMEHEGEIDQSFLIFSDKKKAVYREYRVLEQKSNDALGALKGDK